MWNIFLKQNSDFKKINEAVDVSDAINKSFEHNIDKVIIILDSIEIEMCLVYQFSDLFEDFLNILTDVIDNENGDGYYGFSQNDLFDADWNLSWDNDYLEIKIKWRIFKDKDISSLPNQFHFSKKEYINSWKIFLNSLYHKLDLDNLKLEYNDEKLIINEIISEK
ncbi:hypothetical protein [Chryseobacterium luquanense]|uniref:Uncharacterized protein n=1 Tax=Chryseobacterium luquanense TaxID=2983766 RepID=A0ABT3Y834_9FLAO|nr:hypothetical protein [Chryseobacterium luquanense]MCX8534328.1 hypothetical protein [Chryseobacterium luquanense]